MQKNVIVVHQQKSNLSKRFNQALAATVAYAVVAHANAASALDITPLTDEITGAKGNMLILFGLGLTVIGLLLGWKYMKKGSSAA